MIRNAELSSSGKYRWWLSREWGKGKGEVAFIMLNPSKADAFTDDPTIRRCINFAKSWGYKRLYVVNLFALRATKPSELKLADDPVGKRNDAWIETVRASNLVVAAWGSSVPFERDQEVLAILSDVPLFCLGRTKNGRPRHPLFCRADVELIRYEG